MNSRVMLVDQTAGRSAILEQSLRDEGYHVVARLAPSADLIDQVHRLQPDIVIMDMDSPDRDTLECLGTISREQPKPIVMFAEESSSDVIEAAVRAGVSAYVVDGMEARRLRPILEVAIARFREFQALRRELVETKTKLADRKDVDKAKGLLMRHKRLSEEDAYQALRKMAMDRNITIGEAARALIAASELLL